MSKEITDIINKLYQSVDAMQISLSDRDRLQLVDSSFTYGEIKPESFAAMLAVVEPKKGEVFYDIGSGAGKAVLCAALLNNWKKCCGIEVLPGLFEMSRLMERSLLAMHETQKILSDHPLHIEFIQEDALKIDFSEANVVFLHATTFSPALWESLRLKLNMLKMGARVIVNTKQLDAINFEKIDETIREMGWGESCVFTYRRK